MSAPHPHKRWAWVPAHRRHAVVELLRTMADDARVTSESDAGDCVALDLHAAANLLDLAGPARRPAQQRDQPRPRLTVRRLLKQRGGWWYSVDVARETGLRVDSANSQLRKLWRAGILESEIRPSPCSNLNRRYYRAIAAQEAAE